MRGPKMIRGFVTFFEKSLMPQDISSGLSCVCVCMRLLCLSSSDLLVSMPSELPRRHLRGPEDTTVAMAAGSLSSPCTWPCYMLCAGVSGIGFDNEATAIILVLAARRGGMAFPR